MCYIIHVCVKQSKLQSPNSTQVATYISCYGVVYFKIKVFLDGILLVIWHLKIYHVKQTSKLHWGLCYVRPPEYNFLVILKPLTT